MATKASAILAAVAALAGSSEAMARGPSFHTWGGYRSYTTTTPYSGGGYIGYGAPYYGIPDYLREKPKPYSGPGVVTNGGTECLQWANINLRPEGFRTCTFRKGVATIDPVAP